MSKYQIRYGRKDNDVYYIDVFDDEIAKIFDDLSKYGYSFIQDSKISRAFGLHFKPFRASGIFSMGWDKMKYTSILALSQNYSIKKDEKRDGRYILYRF